MFLFKTEKKLQYRLIYFYSIFRENVIDFTKPFMNLGISILFKNPEIQDAELFSFMNPFAVEIWLYILLAYLMVSLTIWIVARSQFSVH